MKYGTDHEQQGLLPFEDESSFEDAKPPPSTEFEELRRERFRLAARQYDRLSEAAPLLGFSEPDLEEAHDAWSKSENVHLEASCVRSPDQPELEVELARLEDEFVRLAQERWTLRVEEFPTLERLWTEAEQRARAGETLTPRRIRIALGVKSDYEARLDRRRERLEEASSRATSRSDDAYKASRSAVEHIPLGQPILVGHHSERGHRRDIERARRAMDRSLEEHNKAKSLARAARAVGKGGISSDDPEAAERLEEQLAAMEQRREMMKRVNRQYRKGGFEAVDGLGEETKRRLEGELARMPWIKQPFPSYALSNLGANIRRVRARIATLRERDASSPNPPEPGEGYVLEEDRDSNRIRFVFDEKPSADVRTTLKQHGFRWARGVGAWQRQLSDAGRAAADQVKRILDG